MRILWITNIPSPYRLKFFSELGKQAELTVLFEKGFSAERDETWRDFKFENFTGVILKGISVNTDMALSFGFRQYIRMHKNDIIVVSNPITPTGISAILYMQLHNIRYCIESDGAFPKECVGIRGKLKKRLYSKAYLCLTTSELGKQYFMNYGVSASRIEKYPFSSLYEKEIVAAENIIEKKKKAKESISINEDRIVLAVGQFVYRKGFENLILAAKKLPMDVGIYLIGGNPGEEYIKLLDDTTINRVHFLPFMNPERVKQYYLAADVFAFPTHEDIWGLVVNEALAQATPVISTDKCISALEMISNEQNGYIIPDSDIEQLANRIEITLMSNHYKAMCEQSVEIAKKYTIESMVRAHFDIFSDRLK